MRAVVAPPSSLMAMEPAKPAVPPPEPEAAQTSTSPSRCAATLTEPLRAFRLPPWASASTLPPMWL